MIMRKLLVPMLLCFSLSAFAAEDPKGTPIVELKDGGKVYVQKDGSMVHLDAAGSRVKMRDGQMMEAKDGSKIMMKNNAIWKKITEQGTLSPKVP
jgi:hypothetical protein